MTLGHYTSPAPWQRHRKLGLTALLALPFVYGFIFGLTQTALLLQLTIPLVIMAAAVVWLLPETQTPPLRLLTALFYAFVIVLLIWPDYLAIALPGLPWITLIRLVGVPLTFVFLLCLSVSQRTRTDLTEVLSGTPLLWKALVLFAIIATLSVAVSTDPGISISKLLVAVVNWFVIYFVAAYVFRTPGRIERFAYLLWIITIIVSLIGIQEWRHSVVPWAGRIPSFLAVQDEHVQRILQGAARAATGIYRVQSKFTTSLGLAEFYALAFPFIIHFAFTARRLPVRIAAVAMVPFTFWMIVKTDSRLGMVGFFFAILFYTLVWGVWRWRRDRGSMFGPAVVLSYPAVFCAFIAATFYVGRLRALVWGTGAQQASTDSRKLQFAMGIPRVFQRPWGYGAGRGAETLGFQNGAGVLTIDTYYLAVALEYGILGFLAYYFIFLNGLWNGARRMGRALDHEHQMIGPISIALVNFIVIKSIFSQQENHPLVFILLGALTAICWRIDAAARAAAPIAEIAPTRRGANRFGSAGLGLFKRTRATSK